MILTIPRKSIYRTILEYALIAMMISLALILLYVYLPAGPDWRDAYRPAALAMLRGESPYESGPAGFYNAPWTLLPFLPFALMPDQIGRVGVFILALCGFGFIAYRLKAKPASFFIFMTSAAVIGCLNNGNLDWLPMLAILMPARWGLIFAVMKPQIGIGLGLYWLFESWKNGGVRLVIKNFAPVSILLSLSFALYGFWITRLIGMQDSPDNMSVFPYGVMLGLYLLWLSVSKADKRIAMASSPLVAPYVSQFSYAAVLIPLLDRPRLLLAVSILLWIPVLVRVFF